MEEAVEESFSRVDDSQVKLTHYTAGINSLSFTLCKPNAGVCVNTLSRFSLDVEVDLKSALRKLGLGNIFSQSKADFSHMTCKQGNVYIYCFHNCFCFLHLFALIMYFFIFSSLLAEEPLYVSKVLQRVKIEVNEEGTKGSSAGGTHNFLLQ